ncbi:MAG: hypothetical protein IT516_01570 [Burkholderiales bacterium]|nr:hypothetical protein [Burkholderiales bacterium]
MSTVTTVLDLVRAREADRLRRRVEIAIVVSLLLHLIAAYEWFPREPLLLPGDAAARPEPALVARLAQPTPRPSPPPATPASPAPPPTVQSEPPAPIVRPRPVRRPPPKRVPPSVITTPKVAPPIVVAPQRPPDPPVVAPPTPEPPPVPPIAATPRLEPSPPVTGDLSSYIQQRRAARGEASDAPSAAESEAARRDRIVAQNLATLNSNGVASAPQNGGGTFQIRHLDSAEAQFTFYGWNRAINRRMFQVIDVERGANPTINIAIVRKIIAIIRDHEPGDFRWHSKRLGRDLVLSARLEDTGELEAFMMKEFFTDSMEPR